MPPGAACRQEPPAAALLRHAGRDRAADLHLLRERCRPDPLLLPALPGEPDSRRARVPWGTHQARLPRSWSGTAAAHATGCAGAGARTSGDASAELSGPRRPGRGVAPGVWYPLVVGAWRSLVAHLNGVQEVERSN